MRASQAEWAENPLDKEVELKEVRTSILGDNELIARLKQENKKLLSENESKTEVIKKQQEENKKQQEEIKKLRGLDHTIADAKRANQLRRAKAISRIVAQEAQLKEEDSADMMTVSKNRRSDFPHVSQIG